MGPTKSTPVKGEIELKRDGQATVGENSPRCNDLTGVVAALAGQGE